MPNAPTPREASPAPPSPKSARLLIAQNASDHAASWASMPIFGNARDQLEVGTVRSGYGCGDLIYHAGGLYRASCHWRLRPPDLLRLRLDGGSITTPARRAWFREDRNLPPLPAATIPIRPLCSRARQAAGPDYSRRSVSSSSRPRQSAMTYRQWSVVHISTQTILCRIGKATAQSRIFQSLCSGNRLAPEVALIVSMTIGLGFREESDEAPPC